MGRRGHVPTKGTRDTVSLHAMVGTRQEVMCEILGITEKTLRRHYRKELDTSLAMANATIGGNLFNKAKNGNVVAQMFWLKTRAGFREYHSIEHSDPDGNSPFAGLGEALESMTKAVMIAAPPKTNDPDE